MPNEKVKKGKPEENGKVEDSKVIQIPKPQTFFLVFTPNENRAKDAPNRLHVSNEIRAFVEMVSASRVDVNFQKVYTLNDLEFHIVENIEEVKPK